MVKSFRDGPRRPKQRISVSTYEPSEMCFSACSDVGTRSRCRSCGCVRYLTIFPPRPEGTDEVKVALAAHSDFGSLVILSSPFPAMSFTTSGTP
ncbi:hypothetical protein C8Q79DRAFT_448162 [Trametes meyenii]|nr:hypothetical protein C8Q79DRAFT_448162 [Trametes meyenii]